MLSFLCGNIVECYDNMVTLKCGEVGYELAVTTSTLLQCHIGDNICLYCYLQVKDDGLSLYGFSTREEKQMFLRLITVSGIGCKLALAILSGTDSNSLALAIFNNDIKALTSIKGLGKKTAERLVLELKEKVTCIDNSESTATDSVTNIDSSAVALLVTLGLSEVDATKRVETAKSLGANTTEEIINMALRIS